MSVYLDIRKRLAELYPIQSEWLRKIRESEMDVGRIALNPPPITAWTAILDYARDHGATQKLLTAVLRDHNEDSTLSDLCKKYISECDVTDAESGEGQLRKERGFATILKPPIFSAPVKRGSQIEIIQDSCVHNSVVCVAGLPGSGKTYAVSQVMEQQTASRQYSEAVWFSATKDDTLQSMIAACGSILDSDASHPNAQCSILINILRHSNRILVVDDFHNAQQETFVPLIQAAIRVGPPTRLLIISRVFPESLVDDPTAVVLTVNPFSADEATDLLKFRNINDLNSENVASLLKSTAGLPLAITLFCTLKRLGYTIDELLEGDLTSSERLRKWFDEISMMITSEETKLLQLLSVLDGPFDRKIAKHISSRVLERDYKKAFDVLVRSFLVDSCGAGRWRVHDLVGGMCRATIEAPISRAVFRVLANYHNQISGGWRARPKSDGDLQNKVQSFEYFVRSEIMNHEAREIISTIIPEMKRRGLYLKIIELGRKVASGHRDSWLDYHLAHCCMILGEYEKALDVVGRLVYSDLSGDANLKLSSHRLYAEILGAVGNLADAARILAEAITSTPPSRLRHNTLQQAEVSLVGLEIRSGKYDTADDKLEQVIRASIDRGDFRAQAIAIVWKGVLELRQKSPEAPSKFEKAKQLFSEVGDVRGYAWAQCRLTEASIVFGQLTKTGALLEETASLYERLGVPEPGYIELLKEAQKLGKAEQDVERFASAELEKWSKIRATDLVGTV